MREFLESTYGIRFLAFNEPTGDEDASVQFIALHNGRMILADSLPLILSALVETPRALAA